MFNVNISDCGFELPQPSNLTWKDVQKFSKLLKEKLASGAIQGDDMVVRHGEDFEVVPRAVVKLQRAADIRSVGF